MQKEGALGQEVAWEFEAEWGWVGWPCSAGSPCPPQRESQGPGGSWLHGSCMDAAGFQRLPIFHSGSARNSLTQLLL